MHTQRPYLWFAAGLLAVLAVCGVGGAALVFALRGRTTSAPTADAAQLATWAAATVAALAPTPGAGTPTTLPADFTPAALPTTAPTTPAPPPTPLPSPTPVPSPTPPCLAAAFVRDVTVPDGTLFEPNETFTKTWRVRNVGACTWTTAFTAFFDQGARLNAPAAVNLPHAVEPGETVDISVNMQAPPDPGTYKGYWKLRDDRGQAFGIGDDRTTAFWVEIKVVVPTLPPPPPPILDFYTEAPRARWVSDAGVLPFGGPSDDARGFVLQLTNPLLEDGSRPTRVLETHPEWVDNGVISGTYPAFTVMAGHRFRAQIGFLALADGSCGVGDAIFQLNYLEGDSLHPLGEWHESCDGSLRTIDLDLSALAGRTVEFVLAVMANGSSAQDWAVWVEPRIEVP